MMQQQSNRKGKLSQEERIEVAYGVRDNLSIREIGKKLGRHHSTISRELERNSIDKGWGKFKYDPIKAHRTTQKRREKANHKHIILWKDHKQRKLLIRLLKKKGGSWGADEILGRLKEICGEEVVSITTFYRFIREEMPELQRYLRYKQWGYRTYRKGNKRKKKYTDVPNISERPKEAENREEIGHWEGDTIISNREVKGGLVTLVDRKSRYLITKKIGNHKSETVRMTIEAMLEGEKVKTTTWDNGVEFAQISKLGYLAYRCNAYASYERPTNERTNGMIRWFIPKGANINEWTDYQVQEIQNKLNHKPRKILGYRTSYEVYHNISLTYI